MRRYLSLLALILLLPFAYAHTGNEVNGSDKELIVSSMMEHMGFNQEQAEGMYDYMMSFRSGNMMGFGSGMMGGYGMMSPFGWFLWWLIAIGLIVLIYLAIIKLAKDILGKKK